MKEGPGPIVGAPRLQKRGASRWALQEGQPFARGSGRTGVPRAGWRGQARGDGMGEGSLARGWLGRVDCVLQVVSRQSVWAGLGSDDRLVGGGEQRQSVAPGGQQIRGSGTPGGRAPVQLLHLAFTGRTHPGLGFVRQSSVLGNRALYTERLETAHTEHLGFQRSGVQHGPAGSSARGLSGLHSWCRPGCALICGLDSGRSCFLLPAGAGGIPFLVVIGRRVLSSCWLETRGRSKLLEATKSPSPWGSLPAAHVAKASRTMSLRVA